MPSTLPRLPVRVSPGLRDLIAQAGPVGLATRALLILGAQAAGLDVAPVAHEALALLGRPGLPPGVRVALLELAGQQPQAAPVAPPVAPPVVPPMQSPATPTPAPVELPSDLLAGVGIEV